MPFPIAAAMFGGTVLSQIWNAYEARKNRDFQERMSSTAHQREVADLRAAGINPMVSRMGSGASTPGGDRAQIEDLGKGAASALQVKLLAGQVELLRAQTKQAEAGAVLYETQAGDIAKTGQMGRYEEISSRADLAKLSVDQQKIVLENARKRAEVEIAQMASTAKAQDARRLLDELASTGAMNVAEWEARVGEMSPAMRVFFEMIRSLPVRPR